MFLIWWCSALCTTTWNEAVILLASTVNKHACQCEGVRVARRLLALLGEQSFIFVQDLNTSFHNIQKTPLTKSGFEAMFLHCIKSARFDAQLHESPSNASMWKYYAQFNITFLTFACDVSDKSPTSRAGAPSSLSWGEHGLIPEQRLDTEPTSGFY